MQTHKNVKEMGSYYEGQQFLPPSQQTLSLYRRGDQWYIAAQAARFRLKYPAIYDSIFCTHDNAPRHQLIEGSQAGVVYHPLSAGTAAVLQRADGYADLDTLAEEIRMTPGEWTHTLPGAQRYPVRAQIHGEQAVSLLGKRRPEEIPLSRRILSNIDFVCVDIPGTLIYNVAIPVMAPFVFFHEFLKND